MYKEAMHIKENSSKGGREDEEDGGGGLLIDHLFNCTNAFSFYDAQSVSP